MEQKLINSAADTIAAISTPAGSGGIAVVRLSGPDALAIADCVWKGARLSDAKTHTAHLGLVLDAKGETLDQAVATVFRGPNSFTGEDTVEFSIHGGRWLQRAVTARLVEAGARAATAGEFSRRAYLNGRLDLAQAEGIADLIAAESRAAQRLAISQTIGSFSANLDRLRSSLIDFAAMLELELDFSEEDVEFADRSRLLSLCDEALQTVGRLADSFRKGQVYKEGVPVAIVGAPNAGKSTLLNRLSGDDLAIVSDIPGTTRDVIEARVEIQGTLFRFSDTAGLRADAGVIEKEGIARARKKIAAASLILWIIDAADPTTDLESIAAEIQEARTPDTPLIVLLNKSDLQSQSQRVCNPREKAMRVCNIREKAMRVCNPQAVIGISAATGQGIDALEKELVERFAANDLDASMTVSNARHYASLCEAREALARARQAISDGISADFIAQDVRQATDALAAITGAIPPALLLQTIFSRFCIGK